MFEVYYKTSKIVKNLHIFEAIVGPRDSALHRAPLHIGYLSISDYRLDGTLLGEVANVYSGELESFRIIYYQWDWQY